MILTDAMKCDFEQYVIFRKIWDRRCVFYCEYITAAPDDPDRFHWIMHRIDHIKDIDSHVILGIEIENYKLSEEDKLADDWECKKFIWLKECPFCGNEDVEISDDPIHAFQRYSAFCLGCGAASRECHKIETAVKRWNTRIP